MSLNSSSQIHRLPSQSLSQLLSQRPLSPISTSIPDFDHELSGGVVPGQIYEVSGLNGTGKTSLACQLCVNALKMNKQVLWITTFKNVPLDRLSQVSEGDTELFSNLRSIRCVTLGSLFLFLQSLRDIYGLLIIEDISILIERSFANLEKLTSRKDKGALKIKHDRVTHDILKILSTYCVQKRSACCLLNSVDVSNMSFVQTQEVSLQKGSSSSEGFLSSQLLRPEKPKVLYQPIITSSLGDNASWDSFIRARILLYKDWVLGSKVATFAHIRYNPMMKRILQYRNHIPRMVSFEVTGTGIHPVTSYQNGDSDASHSFVINEEIFSSDAEGLEDEEDSCTLLASSPRQPSDIQNSRELFESTVMEGESSNTTATDELVGKVEDFQQPEQNSGEGEQNLLPQSESVERQVLEAEEQDEEHVEIELHKEDVEEEVKEIPQVQADPNISFKEMEEPGENLTESEDEPANNLLHEQEDIIGLVEIDDELEELYPTQPESLSVIQLSQLPKRINNTLYNQPKRKKYALNDLTNLTQDLYRQDLESQEDYIPSSEPYF